MAGATDASDLATVNNGDGTWSYVRPDGVIEGQTNVIGPVTWKYQSQDRYPITATASSGPFWVDVPAGYRDRSAIGQVVGSQRVDDQGGEWLAADLDVDALTARIAAQDDAASAVTGIVMPASTGYVPGLVWHDAESYWYQPYGYTAVSCASTGVTYEIYGADDRWRQTSLTNRQQTVALVDVQFPAYSTSSFTVSQSCNGVFLWSGAVLTSAHCVFKDGDTSSVRASAGHIQVCSRMNAYAGADCVTAEDYVLATGYLPGGGISDDLAIIHVPSISGHGYMWIQEWSDGTLTDDDMHNIAAPPNGPPTTTCGDNTASPINTPPGYAYSLLHSLATISAPITHTYYTSTFDAGPGHSGSPIYFCGDSWCNTGEQGYIVGILSGWNGSKVSAAKVNSHYLWIGANW